MPNEGLEQRACGTIAVHERLLRTDERYAARRREIEHLTLQYAKHNARQGLRSGIVVIPVVVHVVWRTAADNITDAQILSQIATLNEDYRRLNADAGSVPAAFQPVAADCRIQFQLAARDPNCGATNGITRTQTNVVTFDSSTDDVKAAATGGADPWPADRYLNIWVCDEVSDPVVGALLGYAQFPGGPDATDGVVVIHSAFGNTGTAAAPFDLGRTTTHEIGHYLNLNHVFEGGCGGTDNVADTPTQANPNYTCPTFPSVSCNNGPNGDMFMNYMDYVDDDCMYTFTLGQSTRMDATLYGVRSALVASDALVPPAAVAGPDLWSANTAFDIGDEPDAASTAMWLSDDIWVRRQNDGIANQEHQNPEYRPAGFGSNFVYVRVRNRGCAGSGSADVDLRWAKASTGLGWPAPWDGSVTTPAVMGGVIGSAPTGAVAAGDFTILEFPWWPPNPADYASFGADQGHFCLLARVLTSPTAPFGMTFPEGSDLYANVRNNNNIVWKNITVVDEVAAGGRMAAAVVVTATGEKREMAMLEFTVPATDPRSVFDWGTVTVELSKGLAAVWRDSGAESQGIKELDENHLLVFEPGAFLANVALGPGEFHGLTVSFEPNGRTESTEVFTLDVLQYDQDRRDDGPVGGQRFVLKTAGELPGAEGDAPTLWFDGVDWQQFLNLPRWWRHLVRR